MWKLTITHRYDSTIHITQSFSKRSMAIEYAVETLDNFIYEDKPCFELMIQYLTQVGYTYRDGTHDYIINLNYEE